MFTKFSDDDDDDEDDDDVDYVPTIMRNVYIFKDTIQATNLCKQKSSR